MSQEAREQSIGIALSGGGFRATIFSLGVLYYMVERGLGKRIRYVASVSGGSVTNGYVAQQCDLSSVAPEQFQELVRAMGTKVAHEGLFSTALMFFAGTALTLWAEISAVRALAMVATLLIVANALHLRGTALSWALGWQLFRRDGSHTKLKDLSARTVRHVIIATELSLGRPVFIESEWIHGPGMAHGYGKSGHVSLHRAVCCSCTVPLLLPPCVIRTNSLSPENAIRGENLDLPISLSLVDGGVCNNLGSDYHEIDSAFTFGTRPEGFYKAPDVDLKITVNCSGALKTTALKCVHIPVLSELLALPRNIAILYQNTILPRLASGVPTISIERHPGMQLFVGEAKGGNGPSEQIISGALAKLRSTFANILKHTMKKKSFLLILWNLRAEFRPHLAPSERKQPGYTQEDMISFGFSARHWQQIEAGRPITLTTLLRISENLKTPPERLIKGLYRVGG